MTTSDTGKCYIRSFQHKNMTHRKREYAKIIMIEGILVILLVISFIGSSHQELQITTDPGRQASPAIYKDIVVWHDSRNGNYDIYGYNVSTEKEFQITTDPSNQHLPAIYKDIVVWEDCRNDNKDIYGYNLTTEQEFPITTDPGLQRYPVIYNNNIVWNTFPKVSSSPECDPGYTDKRLLVLSTSIKDYGMCGFNLSESRTFWITKKGVSTSSRIYKDIVVWTDSRHVENISAQFQNCDIYGYNLVTKKEFQITADPNYQVFPAIYEDMVVWTDSRNGNLDIYGCTLSAIPEQSSTSPFYLAALVVIILIVITVWRLKRKKGP